MRLVRGRRGAGGKRRAAGGLGRGGRGRRGVARSRGGREEALAARLKSCAESGDFLAHSPTEAALLGPEAAGSASLSSVRAAAAGRRAAGRPGSLRAALLASLVLPTAFGSSRAQSSVCAANSYASGGACVACAAGTFSLAGATSAAQCRPTPFAGPTDTVFSFYGTAAEVAADYSISGPSSGVTTSSSIFGETNAALSLSTAVIGLTTTSTRPSLPSGNSARTMSSWVKIESCSGYWPILYGWGHTSPTDTFRYQWWYLAIGPGLAGNAPSGAPFMWGHYFGSWDSSHNICDRKWHHLAWTFDGSSPSSFYVDGTVTSLTFFPDNVAPGSVNTPQNEPFYLGKYVYASDSGAVGVWSGSLFDIRVYSRALSAAEVLAISQPPLNYPNTVAPTLSSTATSYSFPCVSGFVGSSATLTRSSSDNSWSWASGAPPSCSCPSNTYSYGGSACASCPAGAHFVSASAGCRPATAPTDTAFFLSGSSAEGVTAFSTTIASPTYVTGPFGTANSALALSSGQYLSAAGASAPSFLPSGGNVAWSASAWVKCAAPATWSGVLELGETGDLLAGVSPRSLALGVGGIAPPPNSGTVTTLAGSGYISSFPFGDFADGPLSSARFSNPCGIAVVPSTGVVLVGDQRNNRVRFVPPTGDVTSMPGFSNPCGIAVTSDAGDFVVADDSNNRVCFVSAGGSMRVLATYLGSVRQLSVTSTGKIVIADSARHTVSTFSTGEGVQVPELLAGSGTAGFIDGTGAAASFNNPYDVAVLSTSSRFPGFVAVTDAFNHCTLLVSPQGVVTTLAGGGPNFPGYQDGSGSNARFTYPGGLAINPATNTLVVADGNNQKIRIVTLDGIVSSLAGSGTASFANGVGLSASFNQPSDVAVNPVTGTIVVADSYSQRIRAISVQAILPACDMTWHRIALTYSPTETPYSLSAFLDGARVFVASASITLPMPSLSSLRIGWSGDLSKNLGSLFTGSLAELCIYNRSLSSAEVVALSQPPLAAYPNTSLTRPFRLWAQHLTPSRAPPSLSVHLRLFQRALIIAGLGLEGFLRPARPRRHRRRLLHRRQLHQPPELLQSLFHSLLLCHLLQRSRLHHQQRAPHLHQEQQRRRQRQPHLVPLALQQQQQAHLALHPHRHQARPRPARPRQQQPPARRRILP